MRNQFENFKQVKKCYFLFIAFQQENIKFCTLT